MPQATAGKDSGMEKRRNICIRLGIAAVGFVAVTICVILTRQLSLETTTMKITGSYISLALLTAVLWRFPRWFYLLSVLFHFLAASLGSVVNLYHYINFYDRAVHYCSGILLGAGGLLIFCWLFQRCHLPEHRKLTLLCAFFFSAACAGFWEIYEFTVDQLLHGTMQGDNLNTMGDIVSGVLGALTFSIAGLLPIKRRKTEVKEKQA